MEWYLSLVWAGIIGSAVVLYVILDGFDLGIGVLFPFARDDAERDQMMASIAPFWDGNETWLVMGGVGLLVAFPPAYAIVMPAFYLPVMVMLLALVFRGVAFEFRGIGQNKALWNIAFTAGSAIAGFAQGTILGGLVQGVRVENGAYTGGPFDWATPFALLCGCGVLCGYALLGATWLVMKTSGPVADRARKHAIWLLYFVLIFMAAVSLWTPIEFAQIRERWFSLPNFFYLWPVPLFTLLTAFVGWVALRMDNETVPFFATVVLFLLGFAGLGVSRFPYLVPPSLTIWQTAAPPASQSFMLVGTAALLPVVLAYTAYVYWLFRGKIGPGESYHR